MLRIIRTTSGGDGLWCLAPFYFVEFKVIGKAFSSVAVLLALARHASEMTSCKQT
mgnify:CR=1 FL=1